MYSKYFSPNDARESKNRVNVVLEEPLGDPIPGITTPPGPGQITSLLKLPVTQGVVSGDLTGKLNETHVTRHPSLPWHRWRLPIRKGRDCQPSWPP